jgi:hypothetical protein
LGYEKPRKQAYKKDGKLVRVLGITKKEILSLPQYQIQPEKMPVYSNTFERTVLPTSSASANLIQSSMMVSNAASFGNIKAEGMPVISLSFNPYN